MLKKYRSFQVVPVSPIEEQISTPKETAAQRGEPRTEKVEEEEYETSDEETSDEEVGDYRTALTPSELELLCRMTRNSDEDSYESDYS